MRLLIDCRVLTRGVQSGIPIYAKEVISRIIQNPAHEYTLLTTGLRQTPLPSKWIAQKNVTHLQSRAPNKLLDATMRIFKKPLWDVRARADVVFSPHFNQMPFQKTPRVLTCHDISFIHFKQFYSKKERMWHALQDWRNQLNNARAIIAVSEYTRQDLISTLHIPADKIHRIYPGIGREFKPLSKDAEAIKRFCFTYYLKQPYILAFGSFASRKNLELLIRSFSLIAHHPLIKDYELVLAGNLNAMDDTLKKLITTTHINKRIRTIANIPDEERVLLYNGASLFIFPSFFEGFGFPPLEAQACGVPVIASNRTSLPEILGAGARYIDPWSAHDLASAMIELISSPAKQKELIRVGLENSARFSWDRCASDTLSLIERSL